MELGVEFMEVGLFEQIAAHLHHTVRPDTIDGVEDGFWDGVFGASFSRHGETIMAHSANRKSDAVRARCSQRPQGMGCWFRIMGTNSGSSEVELRLHFPTSSAAGDFPDESRGRAMRDIRAQSGFVSCGLITAGLRFSPV